MQDRRTGNLELAVLVFDFVALPHRSSYIATLTPSALQMLRSAPYVRPLQFSQTGDTPHQLADHGSPLLIQACLGARLVVRNMAVENGAIPIRQSTKNVEFAKHCPSICIALVVRILRYGLAQCTGSRGTSSATAVARQTGPRSGELIIGWASLQDTFPMRAWCFPMWMQMPAGLDFDSSESIRRAQ